MLFILLAILALAIFTGSFGHSRFGYYGWSPLGIILVALLVLYLTGHLQHCRL